MKLSKLSKEELEFLKKNYPVTMGDPTNKERGHRVITMLDAYIEAVEPGDEGEDWVFTDFIADLLHLAHLRGHDAKKIANNALNHFENETSEEGS